MVPDEISQGEMQAVKVKNSTEYQVNELKKPDKDIAPSVTEASTADTEAKNSEGKTRELSIFGIEDDAQSSSIKSVSESFEN